VIIYGDFADVLIYLSQLFAKKKMREIEIQGIHVKYLSCTLIGAVQKNSSILEDFPPIDKVDHVDSISLLTDAGEDKSSVQVTIKWDSYEFTGKIDQDRAEFLIDLIDRSTFRYF
jgi:hypothetical protein